MDLSALDSSLPPGLADAERDMGDKFRAAALSITNLYKSSLACKKQSYQAGYSACLSDVLSTVQSSIGAGQDASQTLSRLMDWAEARELAMAAFAAEDADDTTTPAQTPLHAPQPVHRRAGPGLAASTRHQLHLQQSIRSSSAPLPLARPIPIHAGFQTPALVSHVAGPPSTDESAGPSRHSTREREMPSSAHARAEDDVDPDRTFVQGSTPLDLPSSAQPTPAAGHQPQSSPTVSSRPTARLSRSPLRYKHDSAIPSVPFAPSLPANLAHLPSHAINVLASPAVPVGSKRPLSVHMDDVVMGGLEEGVQTITPSSRSGRSNKRRKEDKERERERREAREGREEDKGKDRERGVGVREGNDRDSGREDAGGKRKGRKINAAAASIA